MFGAASPPQNEKTPFCPRSPYAAAKVYAYWITVNYREGYNLFNCNGILFNHESPRRGETFVTRKITRAIAHMMLGKQKRLFLGNLESKRDWGFAPEYVECQWMILQQDRPDDFVIGTGESHSVREFLEKAFHYAGIEIEWQGQGIERKGIIRSLRPGFNAPMKAGDPIILIDPKYFRPTEVDFLQADITKAKKVLGWEPRTTFDELIKIMIDYDFKLAGLTPAGEGIDICRAKGFTYTTHDFSLHERIRERC
jgi:GDPmannose 4,6-dehydratase